MNIVNVLLLLISITIFLIILFNQSNKYNKYIKKQNEVNPFTSYFSKEELSKDILDLLSDEELLKLANLAYIKQTNGGNLPGLYEEYIFDVQEEDKKTCVKILGIMKKQGFKYMRNVKI